MFQIYGEEIIYRDKLHKRGDKLEITVDGITYEGISMGHTLDGTNWTVTSDWKTTFQYNSRLKKYSIDGKDVKEMKIKLVN